MNHTFPVDLPPLTSAQSLPTNILKSPMALTEVFPFPVGFGLCFSLSVSPSDFFLAEWGGGGVWGCSWSPTPQKPAVEVRFPRVRQRVCIHQHGADIRCTSRPCPVSPPSRSCVRPQGQ